eukprot:CAMPEP_0177281822 /NCGR_PEP_ID=MMETSP0367-20130122/71120_1 /TAXON_ID=447022 ORGANISM="Scrippsiella hangoei-like, Strain SHHI-4" /NCGR_SAMPLE_ID=MMETSP0367 /ASSEMBLY_ACC=CAM_ASM_000362 /LENGTH=76 /DNA_ID=CAMNT_0018738679 /DNA_START=18 /DNA_END=245 /DNA_ORIENTATION=+
MAPVALRAGSGGCALDVDFMVKTMRENMSVQVWGCTSIFEFCSSDGRAGLPGAALRRREESARGGAVERVIHAMGE